MLRRWWKKIRAWDDAWLAARAAGLDRGSAWRAASDAATRRAFLKLGQVPGRQGGVIIDVGANRGQFLAAALRRFAPRRVLAIEPLPAAFTELERHYGDDRRIVLASCAVGAATGSAHLEINRHDPASSLLPIKNRGELRFTHRDLTPASHLEVAVRTLDDLAHEHDLDTVELLKIDVQGYELEVLRGAEKLLADVATILLEVSFYPLYEGGVLFWELHRQLEEHGFALYHLGDYQRGQGGVALQGDAVYRRLEATL